MSLLLDALKKAAQEKLDKEKQSERQGNATNNTEYDSDRTVMDADSFASEQTKVDMTSGVSDRTEVDSTTLGAPASDLTEIDTTSIAESDSRLSDTLIPSEQTQVDTTSLAEPSSNQTEYDAELISDLDGGQTELPETGNPDATQIEYSDKSIINDQSEPELELEPDLTGLTIDASALEGHSATEIRREISDEAEDELFAFDREDTTDFQMRGERTTDFNLDPSKHEPADSSRTYSSSLTENMQAEQHNYYAGSPTQAAQIFASKKPDKRNRNSQYLLGGLILLGCLLFGGVWIWEYSAELDQSRMIAPVPRSRSDEPLSAAFERNRPTTQAAAKEEVDPALLIEQEDYSDLLQETLTAYEQEPAVSAKTSTSGKPTPARSGTVPRRTTTASRNGEYTINRTKRHGESLRTVVLRGYNAYQQGELDNAEIAYRQTLTRAPRNRDALLGMAAVNVARQEPERASKYYRELLNLDPRDDLALAGLASLQQQPGQVDAEISRLKLLLVDKPRSAQLHFALGNLYAGQSRWAEAQRGYFNAAGLDEGNPDYIFNLAVSLEHLGQPQPALRFYRQGLVLAKKRHSHFDQALAIGRIQALSFPQ